MGSKPLPKSPPEFLPIRAIAALTGVNAMTLRTWERRYGLIEPGRTPSGRRVYTHDHVEAIRRVVALVQRGIPIGRVRSVLEAERPRADRANSAWVQYRQAMLAGIARFDERELDRVYDEALSLYSVGAVTRRLVLPLLEELGCRWQNIDGAIAEEHFFATYLRSKLGARLQHRIRYADGPRLIAACLPGEHHEIGILLFALGAHEAGFRTLLLGADTPLPDIVHVRRQTDSRAIVLASSIDPAADLLERELPALVRDAGVPVFIGGRASERHLKPIVAAGAIPLGGDIDAGIETLTRRLTVKERSS
jgi:DNA-binding transcriptional MerR regulator/methylmalonyl-CoA mutase cobalamin-binding subunit